MHKKFVPRTYKQQLYNQLTLLQQGSMTVEQYRSEFERLYLACGCHEEEEQKISRFLFGLNKYLANKVELHPYTSFDYVCTLAYKVEKQRTTNNLFRANIGQQPQQQVTPPTTQQLQPSSPNPSNNMDKENSDQKNDESGVARQQTKPHHIEKGVAKVTKCYRCQGLGHIAKECPNRFMITRHDHVLYLKEHENEEDLEHNDDTQSINCYPEPTENMLLTRKNTIDSSPSTPTSNMSSASASHSTFHVGDYVWVRDDAMDKYMRPYSMPIGEGP
ncbi:RNA-binding protein 4 [Bienertia sinuspersici]